MSINSLEHDSIAQNDQKIMQHLPIGSQAPSIHTMAVKKNGEAIIDIEINTEDLKTNKVIFFYPKDNTPHCSIEAKSFSQLVDKFSALNTMVFGISKNDHNSHRAFIQSCNLALPLISDEELKLADQYHAIKTQNFFAFKYKTTARITYFLDEDNIVRGVWPDVQVYSHANEVLYFIEQYLAKNQKTL